MIFLSFQLFSLFLTTFEFYSYICLPIVNNNYICKNNNMDNKDTKDTDNNMQNINLSDIQNEESKIILVLLKVIVDSHPNDADLGKHLRKLFTQIKFD
jgi:hypothetical protein